MEEANKNTTPERDETQKDKQKTEPTDGKTVSVCRKARGELKQTQKALQLMMAMMLIIMIAPKLKTDIHR